MRTIKSWWMVLAFLSGFALAMFAEELVLSWRDNRLEFSAPRVHFLGGKPLDLLHNAEQVPFDFQLTLWSKNRNSVLQRFTDRFVVSYDLWEEKFRVVKTQSPRKNRRAFDGRRRGDLVLASDFRPAIGESADAGRIGAASGQGWKFAPRTVRIGPLFGRPITDAGISLSSLIEIFSRPPQSQQSRWGPYEAGPFTLDELKRSPRRGS